LVSMVDRVAKTSMGQTARDLAAKNAAMEAQIAAMAEQLKGTSTQLAVTAEQSFFERLSKSVPDWSQVNTDKGFLSWLAEADPVYGVPRQQALAAAQQRLDVDRVAAVFNAYTGGSKAPKAADPLASMVSPKGASTVAPVATGSPVITQAQVSKFYDDGRRGVYSAPEYARIESLINAALAEGRIR